jgi:hypothetical protein
MHRFDLERGAGPSVVVQAHGFPNGATSLELDRVSRCPRTGALFWVII